MESNAVGVHPSLDDESLAVLASSDFDAFTELYRRHSCPVFRFVRAQTPSDEVAEDLTAQVFFKALSAAHTWRGDGPYKAWLFRIARNSVSTWRRGKHTNAVVTERIPDSPDPSPTPASHVLVGEARELVWRRVAELPPAQREAVTLRYLKDLSIDEVARVTRRTKGAVRILLHRARTRLRTAMEDVPEEVMSQ
jgi:RNA polymerase sigma-70 factor (ECF subfamily)